MSFTKRDVKDRVVQHPRRYKLNPVNGQTNIYDLEPVPGEVTEAGMPINKAYLQPIEDGLNDALEKTGDGKDITVTFIEATTEADIASGERLSVMFGKILKKFKNIISGTTAVGKAATLDGLLSNIAELNFVKGVTSAIQTQLNGKAPTNHASTANTYGIGNASNFGHVKVRNDLAGTETEGATVSPAKIKEVSDRNVLKTVKLTSSGNWVVPAGVYKVSVILVSGGFGGGNGYSGGGGGGGGAITIFCDFPVQPGQSIPYVVGAGGAGGVATNTAYYGDRGGNSTFSSLSTATGNYGNPKSSTSGAGTSVSLRSVILGMQYEQIFNSDNILYKLGFFDDQGIILASGGTGGNSSNPTGWAAGSANAGAGGTYGSNGGPGGNGVANSGCGGGGGGMMNGGTSGKGGNGGSGFILVSYF